jgi:hypothetical protein
MRIELFGTASPSVLALALLVAAQSHADSMTRLVSESGKVTIETENNIHISRIEGEVIHGVLEVGPDFPIEPGQKVTLGSVHASTIASIPVQTLHGNEGLDKSMHRKLKEVSAPQIIFQCDDLLLKSMARDKNSASTFDARGKLVIAGVTNQISLPLSVIPLEGNKIKITSNTSLRMSSFGIEPPRIETNGGAVKFSDDIRVNIEWIVRRKP